MKKANNLPLLICILVTLLLSPYQLIAEAYFKKDRLQFKGGNAWIPTTNGSTEAIQFLGTALTLSNGTFIDSADKNILHYVAPLVGSIMAFSMSGTSNIPDSWLVCDGSEVRKTDYPILYNTIGDLWGTSSDPSRFKLPDLRNFFLRGADNFGTGGGATGAATRDTRPRYTTIAFSAVNSSTIKTGSYQPNEISTHSHALSITENTNPVSNNHTHPITQLHTNALLIGDGAEGGANFYLYGNDTSTTGRVGATISGVAVGAHTHTYTFPLNTISTAAGSSNPELQGVPKRIHLIYCIKYEPI